MIFLNVNEFCNFIKKEQHSAVEWKADQKDRYAVGEKAGIVLFCGERDEDSCGKRDSHEQGRKHRRGMIRNHMETHCRVASGNQKK